MDSLYSLFTSRDYFLREFSKLCLQRGVKVDIKSGPDYHDFLIYLKKDVRKKLKPMCLKEIKRRYLDFCWEKGTEIYLEVYYNHSGININDIVVYKKGIRWFVKFLYNEEIISEEDISEALESIKSYI